MAMNQLALWIEQQETKGFSVEIKTSLHGGLEPLGDWNVLEGEWFAFTIKGLPDVTHVVQVAQIKGFRSWKEEE